MCVYKLIYFSKKKKKKKKTNNNNNNIIVKTPSLSPKNRKPSPFSLTTLRAFILTCKYWDFINYCASHNMSKLFSKFPDSLKPVLKISK